MQRTVEAVISTVPSSLQEMKSLEEIVRQLKEPFDPELVSWKPQSTPRSKGDGDVVDALVVAYADPRAYSDRLNQVLGAGGWSEQYEVVVCPGQELPSNDCVLPKIVVNASVRIHCLGVTHTGLGESFTDDENAATVAEAQAFKRACTRFGLGRYLYDLPKTFAKYNLKKKKLELVPQLPDWARPARYCEQCTKEILETVIGQVTYSVTTIIANSRGKYKKQLCVPCQKVLNQSGKELGREA